MNKYDNQRLSYSWNAGYNREALPEFEDWEDTVQATEERGDGPYDVRLRISDKENDDAWIRSDTPYDLTRTR